MTRIGMTNIPSEKRIEVALTYIFGIGLTSARQILKQGKINFDKRAKDLTEDETERLKEIIEKNYKTEGALKSEIIGNIKRLKDIGTWRGIRHIKNLPSRGQRTRANARTKRGRRITVATARRVVAEKT